MPMIKQFLILVTILSAATLTAQNQWTVKQCIDHAMQNNIQVKLNQLNEESNQLTVSQNYASFLPDINLNAGQSAFFGRSIDPYTNQITQSAVTNDNASLNGSILLFNGLQLHNQLKQSKYTYLSAKQDLQKIKNDIALNIITAYLQILYNRDLYRTAELQLQATSEQRKRTQRMFELDEVNKSTWLNIDAQHANEELNLINAKNQADQALLNLRQLLELDPSLPFDIVTPAIMLPSADLMGVDANAVYLQALTNQPDIKGSELRIQAASSGLAAARGARMPRLSLNGGVNTSYSSSAKQIDRIVFGNPEQIGITQSGDQVFSIIPSSTVTLKTKSFSDQLDENLSRNYGLQLSIPILNGRGIHTNIKRQKLAVEQANLNLKSAQLTLRKNVEQAVNDAKAAYLKYVAASKSALANKEAFNVDEKKFELQLIANYDYLISKNNLIRSEVNLLQAKYDYLFKAKLVDFYAGKSLEF
ncbi:MAG: hypothetical protein RIQ89_770 [Bacteroidota bacterium]